MTIYMCSPIVGQLTTAARLRKSMKLEDKGRRGWQVPPELADELDKHMSERSFESEIVRNQTLIRTGKTLMKRYNARLAKGNVEAALRHSPHPNEA